MTYLGGNEGLKRVFRHGRASEAAERDPDTIDTKHQTPYTIRRVSEPVEKA